MASSSSDHMDEGLPALELAPVLDLRLTSQWRAAAASSSSAAAAASCAVAAPAPSTRPRTRAAARAALISQPAPAPRAHIDRIVIDTDDDDHEEPAPAPAPVPAPAPPAAAAAAAERKSDSDDDDAPGTGASGAVAPVLSLITAPVVPRPIAAADAACVEAELLRLLAAEPPSLLGTPDTLGTLDSQLRARLSDAAVASLRRLSISIEQFVRDRRHRFVTNRTRTSGVVQLYVRPAPALLGPETVLARLVSIVAAAPHDGLTTSAMAMRFALQHDGYSFQQVAGEPFVGFLLQHPHVFSVSAPRVNGQRSVQLVEQQQQQQQQQNEEAPLAPRDPQAIVSELLALVREAEAGDERGIALSVLARTFNQKQSKGHLFHRVAGMPLRQFLEQRPHVFKVDASADEPFVRRVRHPPLLSGEQAVSAAAAPAASAAATPGGSAAMQRPADVAAVRKGFANPKVIQEKVHFILSAAAAHDSRGLRLSDLALSLQRTGESFAERPLRVFLETRPKLYLVSRAGDGGDNPWVRLVRASDVAHPRASSLSIPLEDLRSILESSQSAHSDGMPLFQLADELNARYAMPFRQLTGRSLTGFLTDHAHTFVFAGSTKTDTRNLLVQLVRSGAHRQREQQQQQEGSSAVAAAATAAVHPHQSGPSARLEEELKAILAEAVEPPCMRLSVLSSRIEQATQRQSVTFAFLAAGKTVRQFIEERPHVFFMGALERDPWVRLVRSSASGEAASSAAAAAAAASLAASSAVEPAAQPQFNSTGISSADLTRMEKETRSILLEAQTHDLCGLRFTCLAGRLNATGLTKSMKHLHLYLVTHPHLYEITGPKKRNPFVRLVQHQGTGTGAGTESDAAAPSPPPYRLEEVLRSILTSHQVQHGVDTMPLNRLLSKYKKKCVGTKCVKILQRDEMIIFLRQFTHLFVVEGDTDDHKSPHVRLVAAEPSATSTSSRKRKEPPTAEGREEEEEEEDAAANDAAAQKDTVTPAAAPVLSSADLVRLEVAASDILNTCTLRGMPVAQLSQQLEPGLITAVNRHGMSLTDFLLSRPKVFSLTREHVEGKGKTWRARMVQPERVAVPVGSRETPATLAALRSIAVEIFERGFGLRGRAMEDRNELALEASRRCGCRFATVKEVFHQGLFEDLDPLRKMLKPNHQVNQHGRMLGFQYDDMSAPETEPSAAAAAAAAATSAAAASSSSSSSVVPLHLDLVLDSRQSSDGGTEYRVQLCNGDGDVVDTVWLPESRVRDRRDLIDAFQLARSTASRARSPSMHDTDSDSDSDEEIVQRTKAKKRRRIADTDDEETSDEEQHETKSATPEKESSRKKAKNDPPAASASGSGSAAVAPAPSPRPLSAAVLRAAAERAEALLTEHQLREEAARAQAAAVADAKAAADAEAALVATRKKELAVAIEQAKQAKKAAKKQKSDQSAATRAEAEKVAEEEARQKHKAEKARRREEEAVAAIAAASAAEATAAAEAAKRAAEKEKEEEAARTLAEAEQRRKERKAAKREKERVEAEAEAAAAAAEKQRKAEEKQRKAERERKAAEEAAAEAAKSDERQRRALDRARRAAEAEAAEAAAKAAELEAAKRKAEEKTAKAKAKAEAEARARAEAEARAKAEAEAKAKAKAEAKAAKAAKAEAEAKAAAAAARAEQQRAEQEAAAKKALAEKEAKREAEKKQREAAKAAERAAAAAQVKAERNASAPAAASSKVETASASAGGAASPTAAASSPSAAPLKDSLAELLGQAAKRPRYIVIDAADIAHWQGSGAAGSLMLPGARAGGGGLVPGARRFSSWQVAAAVKAVEQQVSGLGIQVVTWLGEQYLRRPSAYSVLDVWVLLELQRQGKLHLMPAGADGAHEMIRLAQMEDTYLISNNDLHEYVADGALTAQWRDARVCKFFTFALPFTQPCASCTHMRSFWQSHYFVDEAAAGALALRPGAAAPRLNDIDRQQWKRDADQCCLSCMGSVFLVQPTAARKSTQAAAAAAAAAPPAFSPHTPARRAAPAARAATAGKSQRTRLPRYSRRSS